LQYRIGFASVRTNDCALARNCNRGSELLALKSIRGDELRLLIPDCPGALEGIRRTLKKIRTNRFGHRSDNREFAVDRHRTPEVVIRSWVGSK